MRHQFRRSDATMSATGGLEESLEEEDQLLEEDDEIILDEEEKTSEDLDGSEVLETEVVTLDEDGGSTEESVNQIAVGVPEDNVIVLGEEEEEDDMDLPVDDEDDVLMDDEVYTPPAEAYGNNSSNSPSTGSNDLSSGVESNFATVLRYANVARQVLNSRHPKFRHLNNMEIVHKMVAKGKVVNPADDDDEEDEVTKEDVFLTPRQTKVLEETEGVRVCTEMRSEDDRNGTEVVEVPEGGKNRGLKSKVIVLGGGIPLEPVLAQKRLNEEVEQFRYDLQKHRRCWDNVVFRHPQRKVGWKVDPSTIVPKNNDENDPEAAAATGGREAAAPSSKKAGQLFAPGEIYSTDEDWDVELGKDSELVQGTISAWTFLDEDEEDNRAASRPVPPLKHIQQQHTISGKYHQQMMRQTGTPTPQKQHLSQQQQLQSQGQRSSYMDQRSMSSSTKKVSGRSRSSGTNRHNEPKRNPKDGKVYPKPAFSYSCLIALSLKNSKTGALPVSEIYKFMCDHFPYFNTAPSGWKNSVRHNLSLNKCFEKYGEGPAGNSTNSRKGCLWTLNPAKIHKMDEEVQKWSRKDPTSITVAMSDPENLELLERGEMKKDYSGGNSDDEEEEFVDGNSMTYTLAGGLPMEFGTITNVTGNYSNDGRTIDPSTSQQVVVTSANNGGMTYSVVTYGNEGRVNSRSNNAGQSTTPLIIRRTVVKS